MSFLVAILLAGCGGDSEPQAGTAPTGDTAPTTTGDAAPTTTMLDQTSSTEAAEGATSEPTEVCVVLTVEEINGITGLDVAEGEVSELMSTADQTVCEWHHQGGGISFVQMVAVPGGGDNVDTARESLESAFEVEAADVSVPGAEGAYFWEGQLGMAVGDDFIQVNYLPAEDDPDLEAKTTELATVVAANWRG